MFQIPNSQPYFVLLEPWSSLLPPSTWQRLRETSINPLSHKPGSARDFLPNLRYQITLNARFGSAFSLIGLIVFQPLQFSALFGAAILKAPADTLKHCASSDLRPPQILNLVLTMPPELRRSSTRVQISASLEWSKRGSRMRDSPSHSLMNLGYLNTFFFFLNPWSDGQSLNETFKADLKVGLPAVSKAEQLSPSHLIIWQGSRASHLKDQWAEWGLFAPWILCLSPISPACLICTYICSAERASFIQIHDEYRLKSH